MAHRAVKTVETEAGRASTRFSAELIRQLVSAGHTQTSIAQMLGVTKSYISRVAAGQRALTLDHLAKLEKALGKSMALLVLEGTADPSDTPERIKERERIRSLFDRPVWTGKDEPLPAEEQAEMDRLSDELDQKLGLLTNAANRRKRRANSSAVPNPHQVSKMQVIKLLQREAGLSPAAARRAYEAQARFAAGHGLRLFGT